MFNLLNSFQVSKLPKKSKLNPACYWQCGKKQITGIAFAPDCRHVAIVSLDGALRVIDFVNEMYSKNVSLNFQYRFLIESVTRTKAILEDCYALHGVPIIDLF